MPSKGHDACSSQLYRGVMQSQHIATNIGSMHGINKVQTCISLAALEPSDSILLAHRSTVTQYPISEIRSGPAENGCMQDTCIMLGYTQLAHSGFTCPTSQSRGRNYDAQQSGSGTGFPRARMAAILSLGIYLCDTMLCFKTSEVDGWVTWHETA